MSYQITERITASKHGNYRGHAVECLHYKGRTEGQKPKRHGFNPWVRKIPGEGISYKLLGFPGDSAVKESTCNVGDLGSIPGLGRSFGEWKGNQL